MPEYNVTDPVTGKKITIKAASAEAARAAAATQLRPKKDDRNAQRVEGFVQPLAGLADLLNPYRGMKTSLTGTAAPTLASRAEGISTAGEKNQTPVYSFWRGIGRGTVGIGSLAATGGASLPLAAASMAGGLVGSGVESATGSPMAGLAADTATTLATGNPGAAMRLAGRLRLGGGGAKDVVAVAGRNYESAIASARAAFARVPSNVSGSENGARLVDTAQTLVRVNSANTVPGFIKTLAKMKPDAAGDVPMDFHTLQRAIGAMGEHLRKGGPKSGVAAKIAQEVDDMLVAFKANQSTGHAADALEAARKEWGAMRAAFPMGGSFSHAVLNPKTAMDRPQDAIDYVFNSKNAASQAQLLSNAVVGNRAAESGLRQGYLRFLSGGPGAQNFPAVQHRLDETREIAETLFGRRAMAGLSRTVHKAASRGSDIANHPYLFVMTMSGALGAMGVRGVDRVSTAIAAGTGGYWIWRHFGAQRAQRIFMEAAYDPEIGRLITARATRSEAPEIIRKATALAARNGAIQPTDGEPQ